MALEIRCATAFRWEPPRLAGCECDVLRVEVAIASQQSSLSAAFAEQLAEEGFARAQAAFAAVALIDLSATEVVMDPSPVCS